MWVEQVAVAFLGLHRRGDLPIERTGGLAVTDSYFAVASLAVLALCTVCFAATLSDRSRLWIAAAILVPQFFVGGQLLSLSDYWLGLSGAVALARGGLPSTQRLPFFAVGIVAGSTMFSLLWALPDSLNGGLQVTIRLVIFGLIFVLVGSIHERSSLLTALKFTAPFVAAQAILVILFRLAPDVENIFLRSSVASFFVGPTAAALFAGSANNVLDPEKAGGLYVNGNVASMFGGVAFLAMLYLYLALRERRWVFVAALSLGGVWASGSKTGLALSILLSFLVLVLPLVTGKRGRALVPVLTLITAGVAVAAPTLISRIFPSYASDAGVSYSVRERLWSGAYELFKEEPVYGLGFGGWADRIAQYAGTNVYPPHNIVISAWANSGFLGALAVILFMLVMTWSLLQRAVTGKSIKERRMNSVALCAFLWVFIHGQADNTTIFGDPRSSLLLALLFVLTIRGVADQHVKPVPYQEVLMGASDRRRSNF